MYLFPLVWLVLRTVSATNVFTPPPGEVCSGDIVTFICSRDDRVLEWSYNVMLVVIFDDRNSPGTDTYLVDEINFTVALIFLNNTFTNSNISFTAPAAADGKVLGCTGGGVTSKKTLRIVTSAPVVTDVNSDEVIYDANSLRLTLQFTVINGSGTPTLNVSPPAASLGSLQNTTSSTFSADITLHYNTSYTINITASNCAGQGMESINFLRVVCRVPPSLLAVPVQANGRLPYVEDDMVNFQCLSGLSPADVMIATCTMEGSWKPDPQLLNCSGATEVTTTTKNTGVIAGAVVGSILVLALMLAPCVIAIILFRRRAGTGTVGYKTSNTSAAKGLLMAEYAVTSHTGTIRSESSTRNDPSVGLLMAEYAVTTHNVSTHNTSSPMKNAAVDMYSVLDHGNTKVAAAAGEEYSQIQRDNITPNRHDIQVAVPAGEEYSQIQRDNITPNRQIAAPGGEEYSQIQCDKIPPNRHDIQQASGLQYSLLDLKDGVNEAGKPRKPRGGLTYADVGANLTRSTISNPMMEPDIVYSDVKCIATTPVETKKHPEADASLDLNMMLIQVANMEHLWESYGEAMGVPLDVLAEVSRMKGGNHDKMVEVMDYWFFNHSRNPTPTWREIAKGLKDIGCGKLAEDIMEVYNTGQLPVHVDDSVDLGMLGAMEAPPPLPPKTDESDMLMPANPGHSSDIPPIPEKHMMVPAIPTRPPKQAPVMPSKQPVLPPRPSKN